MEQFSGTTAALVAALVVAGPVSVAVTKVVDFIRNLVDQPDKLPKWIWNAVAFVLGIALCLGWDINIAAAVVDSVPALSDGNSLSGTMGVVLTGVVVGAMAGFWHEKLDQWSAQGHQPPTIKP